jgi:hypothetical protein
MAAGTALSFVLPWPYLVAATLAGALVMRERKAFLLFVAISIPINVAIMAYVDHGTGWLLGLEGGLRLASALGVNLAILTRLGSERMIEGLRLPPRATALLAAILLAARDVGRDFMRLRDARRLEGAWPRGRLARTREASRLLPPLMLAAHRRAQTRREALQMAGIAFPMWFVPLVAIAALASAGRMAFLALPNVALTYVIAFLGGLLFGPLVGAAGAFLGMAVTDLLLTGLYPGGFVNAPAMALLGLLGGGLRRFEIDPALAAAIGIVGTFLFSLAADVLTWFLLYRREPDALAPILVAGLVFNVIPALVNGALFATSVTPTVRAFRAWQRSRAPAATAPPASPDAAPSAV